MSLPSRSRPTSNTMAPMATVNLEIKASQVAVERSWVFGDAQVRLLIDLEYS